MNESVSLLVSALGWTLLHFIWQGCLLALVLALLLNLIGHAQLRLRYFCSFASLLGCLILPARELYLRMTSAPSSLAREVQAWREALTGPAYVVLDSSYMSELSTWLEMHMTSIVLVWLACVLLLSLRLCVGLLWIEHSTRGRRSRPEPAWQLRVNQMAGQFHIGGKVLLRVVDELSTPLTVGIFRPVVLLPASMLTGMSVDLLEMLVAHEMAHIKRHDYLFNLIQSVIEMLLFYHPAVWWIAKQIRNNREEIADELAARVTGEPRRLALALSELANHQFLTPQLAQAAHGGNLMSRIKRLVKPEVKTVNWKMALLILGLTSSSLTLFAHATASPAIVSAVIASTVTDISKAKVIDRDDEKKGDKMPVIDFNKCKPQYPREALNKKETGVVRLSVLIGSDGDIMDTKIDRSSGHRLLDNAVVDKLKTCTEKAMPGKVDGEYAPAWAKVQYVWRLK